MKRDGEGHFIIIKGQIHQDNASILNIYATNTWTHTLVKETLLKLKITYQAPHVNNGRLQQSSFTGHPDKNN